MDEEKADLEQKSVQPPDSGQTEVPESIYKGLQNVPLKVLDIFIGLCIAALVITIVVGVLNR